MAMAIDPHWQQAEDRTRENFGRGGFGLVFGGLHNGGVVAADS